MNESSPVIPSQLSSDALRSIRFQVIKELLPFSVLVNHFEYLSVLTLCFQNDILCLRERDLLNRFAAEVSVRLSQGESKEYAFAMVIYHLCVYIHRSLQPPKLSFFTDNIHLNMMLFLFPYQSYQLAEDLGRAFADRAIFRTFVEAEASVNSTPIKVISNKNSNLLLLVDIIRETCKLL